jgi:hypothetical protein
MWWQGVHCWVTMGDNNARIDAPVPPERIAGAIIAAQVGTGWVDWPPPAFHRICAVAAAMSYAEFAVVRTNGATAGRVATCCARLMMRLLHRAAVAVGRSRLTAPQEA